ncbi:hypothetical protein C8R44DRAFT_767696 [Mycena epipterygia]|nr:hypothetical protein C8R44DRAFT_767696 [Mycena epipterygia]
MPVFLTNAYYLVSALCLLQIGSSLGALAILFDGSDLDRALLFLSFLIFFIINGVIHLWKIYRLLPYSRGSRIDTTISSRVYQHYNWLLNNGISWGYFGIMLSILARSKQIPPAVRISFVLPFVLSVTCIAASQLLRLRARAIHGTEKVLMPQPDPQPWLYHYYAKDVPAWMTPHVAEFETLSLEDETKAEKV